MVIPLKVEAKMRQMHESARAVSGQMAWRAFEKRHIPSSRPIDCLEMPLEERKLLVGKMMPYFFKGFGDLGLYVNGAMHITLHPKASVEMKERAKAQMRETLIRMKELYAQIPFGKLKGDPAYDMLFCGREALQEYSDEVEKFLASKEPDRGSVDRVVLVGYVLQKFGAAYRQSINDCLGKINEKEKFGVVLTDIDGKVWGRTSIL